MTPVEVREVRPDMRRCGLVVPFANTPSAWARMGLRERVRARLSSDESEPSLSSLFFSSLMVSGWGDLVRERRAAERVK